MQTPGEAHLGRRKKSTCWGMKTRVFFWGGGSLKLLGGEGEQTGLWVPFKLPPISSGSNFICFAFLASPKISDQQRPPSLKYKYCENPCSGWTLWSLPSFIPWSISPLSMERISRRKKSPPFGRLIVPWRYWISSGQVWIRGAGISG